MGYIRKLTDHEAVTPSLRTRSEEDTARSEDLPADGTGGGTAAVVRSSQSAVAVVAASDAEAREPSASSVFKKRVGQGEKWIIKRGHVFSYAGLFLFTIVVYFRPYELFPSLSALTSIAFWFALPTLIIFVPSQLAVEGNLTWRPREINLVLLLTLAALLSIPLAIDPPRAWEAFNEFLKVVLIFIVIVNVVRTERRLKGMLFISLASGCLLSVQAWNDYNSGLFTYDGYRVGGVIGGMFGNPNEMALHLVTVIPIAIGMLFATRNVFMKLLYGVSVIFMVFGIVVTFSRAGFLGLIAVVAVLVWKLSRQYRLRGIILMIVISTVFLVATPGNYGSRVVSILNPASEGSASQRQTILHRSIIVSLRHPVFGLGMDCFFYHSVRNLGTHNCFTQVSAELGLAACVLYIMFLLNPLKRLREVERRTLGIRDEARFHYLAIGIQASLIGFMVSGFFAAVAFLWYAYYIVGYAVCLRRLYEVRADVTTASATADDEAHKREGIEDGLSRRFPRTGSEGQAVAT